MADDLNSPITPEAQEHWTKDFDGETVGFLQSRGWDKLDPAAAASEAIKAYRSAANLMKAPPEYLVRIPKDDADIADKQQFWRRLGAPEKADDYRFEGVKWDDAEKTSRFTEAVRKTALELNVPKEMAERLAKTFYDWGAKETADGEAQIAITREGEQRELYRSWGEPDTPSYRSNEFIVDRAMETLGLSKEVGEKLRDAVGPAEFAQLFHKIGLMAGEDKFITAEPVGGGARTPITREQIMSRLADLKEDASWRERLFKGDKNAKREFEDLTRALAR